MGSTSSSQIANSLAQNISNTTMTSLQSSQTISNAVTDITAVCTADDVKGGITACNDCATNSIKYCSTQVTSTGVICSPEQIEAFKDLCDTICTNVGCKFTDVKLSNKIVMVTKNQITNKNFSTISDSIQEKLNQSIKDTTARQTINSKINNITDVVQKTLQTITTSSNSAININVQDISIRGLTVENFVDQVSDSLLSSTDSSKVINEAAVQISQSAEGTYKWIMIVGAILIALLFIIFLILMLAKSKDLKDFFSKMLPVFIWLFLSLLTTLILIFAKPKIVTSVNVQTKKEELNVASLLLWLSVFYIGYGLILFAIWKIKSHIREKREKPGESVDIPVEKPGEKPEEKPENPEELEEL